VDVVHVPYRGTGPALTDLLGGRLEFVVDATTAAIPQVKAGKAKVLAVLSEERHEAFPGVPSAMEKRMGEAEVAVWFAFMAPKGTPDAVVQKLSSAIKAAVMDPAVVERLKNIGATPGYMDSRQLGERIQRESGFWAKTAQRL